MKITLLSETSIRLDPDPGPMTIEALSAEQSYSPFHMLGSSLAYCTFSVMYSWATHAGLNGEDLSIEVTWDFVEDPHRVGHVAMTFEWPSLPEKRLAAAKRVAEMCTVHATLLHPPTIAIDGTAGGGGGTAAPSASGHDHDHHHEHVSGSVASSAAGGGSAQR